MAAALVKEATLRFVTAWTGKGDLKALGTELGKVATGTDKAATGTGRLGKASDKAAPSINKMGAALGDFAQIAAGIGLGALLGDLARAGLDAEAAGRKIVNMAADFGETEQVFNIAAQAADRFTLGLTESERSFGDLYARLRPMGLELEQIQTLFFGVNTAALKAGTSTEDLDEAMRQLSQALSSGVLMWEDLDIILERMPILGSAINEELGRRGLTGSLKELASQGVITTDVMLSVAEAFALTEPPEATAMREFQAAVSDLRRELGENLLPVITPALEALAGMAKAFGDLPEPLQNVVLGVTAFVAALAVAGPIIAATTTALGALGGMIAILAGPVGWALLAAGLVVALVAMQDEFTAFWSWLAEVTAENLDRIGVFLLDFATGGPLLLLLETFRGQITKVFAWVLEKIADLGAQIGTFLNEWVVQPFIRAWQAIAAAFTEWVIVPLQQAWAAIAQGFTDLVIVPIQQAWDALMDWFSSVTQPFVDAITRGWSSLVGFWDRSVVQPMRDSWDWFVATIRSVWEPIQQFLINSWSAVSGTWRRLVVEPLSKAWSWLVETMSDTFGGFFNFVKGIFDQIWNWISSAVNAINRIRGATSQKKLATPEAPAASTPSAAPVQQATAAASEGLDQLTKEQLKAQEDAKKEAEKAAKEALRQAEKAEREQKQRDQEAIRLFDDSLDLMDKLRSGSELSLGELRDIGSLVERIEQDGSLLVRGMELTQQSVGRALELVGPGGAAQTSEAARTIGLGQSPTSRPIITSLSPTGAATITQGPAGTGRAVNVSISTGPITQSGDQRYVTLEAFQKGVRRAALAGGS